MTWQPTLIRGLGSAGAVSNARAELDEANDRNRRAADLVARVGSTGPSVESGTGLDERRVA
jgi:hypothetical protein